jgi:hypothetical protein
MINTRNNIAQYSILNLLYLFSEKRTDPIDKARQLISHFPLIRLDPFRKFITD